MEADLLDAAVFVQPNFVFMQDSAPRAKATWDSLRNFVPDFISAEEWAPHSPDLNALDSVWDILQEHVCEGRLQPYAYLQKLEKAIKRN